MTTIPRRLPALHVEGAGAEIAADLHHGDVAQVNGPCVAFDEDDLLDVGDGVCLSARGRRPRTTNSMPFSRSPCRLREIAFPDRVHDHCSETPAARILVDETSIWYCRTKPPTLSDLGDALNGVELVSDEPVLQGPQLAQIVAAFVARTGSTAR